MTTKVLMWERKVVHRVHLALPVLVANRIGRTADRANTTTNYFPSWFILVALLVVTITLILKIFLQVNGKLEILSVLFFNNSLHFFCWFVRHCFNDQTVSSITHDDIRKTYGGGPSRSAGYFTSAYTSSTNAYMLMYRQVKILLFLRYEQNWWSCHVTFRSTKSGTQTFCLRANFPIMCSNYSGEWRKKKKVSVQ